MPSKVLLLVLVVFAWSCAAASEFVIVTINQTTERDAPKFGFNFEAVQATLNDNDPVLYNWVANYFFLKVLRYPGGSISSFWDWENGAVNQSLCENGMAPHGYCKLAAPYTLEYFQKILQNFPEAIPMWDLNCITDSLESQMSLLAYAEKIGLDISHVELGNEYYSQIDTTVYPNASVYAEAMNEWTDQMKMSFNNSTYALIGCYEYNNKGYAGQWNSEVIKSANGSATAYTLHWYLGDLPGCTSVCHNVSNSMLPSWFNYTAHAWDELVENVVQQWPAQFKEIWVTEYNLRDFNDTSRKIGVVLGSWIHALVFAQQTFSLLSSPTPVSVIMAHALGDNIWKSYVNISTPTREEFAATPFGVVFAAFMKCGMTASSIFQLSFEPQINVSSDYATNALIGYLFKSLGPEGICAVAINLSNETASFYVPRIIPQPVEVIPCSTYTISPDNYFKQNITQKDLVIADCQASVFDPRGITVPPYSFLYLSAEVE